MRPVDARREHFAGMFAARFKPTAANAGQISTRRRCRVLALRAETSMCPAARHTSAHSSRMISSPRSPARPGQWRSPGAGPRRHCPEELLQFRRAEKVRVPRLDQFPRHAVGFKQAMISRADNLGARPRSRNIFSAARRSLRFLPPLSFCAPKSGVQDVPSPNR